MNSITKLFRSSLRMRNVNVNRTMSMRLIRISSFKYLTTANEMINKRDNMDLFGECSCGRSIFQQWRSCYPVSILGNKICQDCGNGCHEYINQHNGDIKLNKCCNNYCISKYGINV
mmetsp:Transcript_41394/g.36594  ORF Transcript_41394/g.36594 Transcript_41394/m.36594 type:complete len:116 (+) Transcript_41394:137-484(+)